MVLFSNSYTRTSRMSAKSPKPSSAETDQEQASTRQAQNRAQNHTQ
jgi:hypothetical protein